MGAMGTWTERFVLRLRIYSGFGNRRPVTHRRRAPDNSVFNKKMIKVKYET